MVSFFFHPGSFNEDARVKGESGLKGTPQAREEKFAEGIFSFLRQVELEWGLVGREVTGAFRTGRLGLRATGANITIT